VDPVSWLRDLHKKRFEMYVVVTLPCPLKGNCQGPAGEDDYGSYVPGCYACGGNGKYREYTYYHVGHLMKGVVDAMWAERAFQEGHSAGLTDAMASRKRT
jgi:hypothetical protein